MVKNPPANSGEVGPIPGSGRSPGLGNDKTAPLFLPGKFHSQRSLASYSLWGYKESDTSERLST